MTDEKEIKTKIKKHLKTKIALDFGQSDVYREACNKYFGLVGVSAY